MDFNPNSEPLPLCGLCKEQAELRTSHVLPAFVFRWLRETSVTGHVRTTKDINRRIQDGEKKPWLCASCEALFAKEERDFSAKLFYPWLSGVSTIEYETWLLRFCTSVSWRVLAHCKGSNANHKYSEIEEKCSAMAEFVWRDFLLGRRSTIGRFEQHLLPLDIIRDTTVADLPDNINRYLTRNIEMDIVGGSGSLMTYAKLGKFAIFGMMLPPRNWQGTRVFGHRGRIMPRRYSLPGSVMWFFIERARMSKDSLTKMSPNQVSKVDDAVLSNIDRFADSDQWRAMQADVAMFGEQAILRKSPRED